MDKVLELKPSSFTWKVRDKGDDVGLIAQQVETVLPNLIKEKMLLTPMREETGMETHKTVDYAKLSVYLIGAIQEQQKQIDELKKKIEDS